MNQFNGVAPGVDFREQIEEATKARGVRNAIGIVGVAMKGPMEAVLLSTPQQCISVFGKPHANNSAVQAALACLTNSGEVWFKRVVSASAKKGTTWEATTGGTPRPWAVFSTKDTSELCNGYSISLVWENVGTVDLPKFKISYTLSDANGLVLESYKCDEDKDAELFIGRIISLYSKYLEVSIEGDAPAADEVTDNSGNVTGLKKDPVTYVISGGNSGIDVTAEDIIGTGNSGMKAFYDPDAIDISTLIVPTWADRKVWEEGIAIGEYRKDIVFIPSLPVGLNPDEVADLVRGVGQFTTTGLQYDKTFVPVYWPNGLKRNEATGSYDVVDIVPYIASAYARSDSIANVWTAPAGVKRGVLEGLDGLEYKTTKEERDKLYSEEINVNPVVDMRGYGITIMGARTSKIYQIIDANTALRYVNIRRLCNYIRKVVLSESMNNLFDQNDYYTWNDWKMRIDPYLRIIKEGRGLYDYEIVMDETTVSQEDIDEGRMPGTIRIAPIKPNEYIIINFVVAKDGTVSFGNEVTL